jgi:hypothetical protein
MMAAITTAIQMATVKKNLECRIENLELGKGGQK